MDPSPILTYLLKQLHEQDSSVIIVLREIINQMAGISQLSNVSTEQIDGLGGGPSLQSTVYNLIGDRRDSSHKSAKRLIECLKKLGMSAELFVILAQIHATFIYHVDDSLAHQKFLAYRYDELTHVLIQYSEMMKYFLDIDDFKQDMLSIPELSIRYGVKASWTFGLWRSILGEEIRKYDNKADVEMADGNDEQEVSI
jgi:THO complex subunit 2